MGRLKAINQLITAFVVTGSVISSLQAEDMSQLITNWPCEQAFVEEVPAAVVWGGPSIAGMEQEWQKDKPVEALARQLASLDYEIDRAETDIAEFADSQQAAEKDRKLTLLFTGVITQLNEQRQKAHGGIIRYADGQAKRANQLSDELDEMVRLQDDNSAEAQQRLAMMQQEMEIKQRMFDERESFIQHLCTRPRLIEEKLGILARTIAYYLE